MTKRILFIIASAVLCLHYLQAQKLSVQLSSVNKNHTQFICVRITNVSSENIFIYSNGYIDANGVVVRAGCSNIQIDAYDNQNRVLCTSEIRPLSNPDEIGVRVINLSPGQNHVLEIQLYSQVGSLGLFDATNNLMTSIVANIDLRYKTSSMSDYERLKISSPALNLNN